MNASRSVEPVSASDKRAVVAALWRELLKRYSALDLTRVRAILDMWSGARPPRCDHPHQEVQEFYMPGLPYEPWLDARSFVFFDAVSSAYPRLRAEAERFLDGTLRPPPVGYRATADADSLPLMTASGYQRPPGWREWKLYELNQRVDERCEPFPEASALADEIAAQTEYALSIGFLLMQPHTEVGLHVDVGNFLVSLQMGLLIPAECGLEVAGESRAWRPGECLAFDNGYRHRAWNRSDGTRILFSVYVVNPRLTDAERGAIAFLASQFDFEAFPEITNK